jgi:adenylate kinase family enzyme
MTAIYLHGDPGTGKTYFVNNMAKILDLPIYEYTRTDCYCEEIGENEPFTTKYANIFTKLIYTAKLNKKNGIILFIDELDTKLKNDSNLITFLLELINKGLFKYIERSINYEINIKNIVIICCGHIKIEDIKYETSIDKNICLKALSSRFLTINFPNITIEYKKNIIKCYINNNYPFINYDKHSEEIDKIIENDNETGIRKLIVDIDYLINKYICDEVFIGTDWEQKIDL